MDEYVYVDIRRLTTTIGLKLIQIAAAAGIIGVMWRLLLSDSSITVIYIVSLILAGLGTVCFAISFLQNMKLSRLKRIGTAYKTAITYDKEFSLYSNTALRVHVKYIDDMGMEVIPKGRWYGLHTNWGWQARAIRPGSSWGPLPILPMSRLELSAKVYVNPDNHKDYAMDVRVKRKQ